MKNKKLVYGVGLNDVDYVVKKFDTIVVNGKKKQKLLWYCPYYSTWNNMLRRCYSTRFQERNPSYRGCTVSDDWLIFSKFKEWMVKQDYVGNCLDKDILFEGNKIYSNDNCVFVSPMVNTFVIDRGNDRGMWKIGVYWNKKAGKFKSQCRNPITKEKEYLGLFECEQDAHLAWRKRKLELAKELAALQSDPRVAKALIERYS